MDTPETDALYERLLKENPGNYIYLEEFLELARKLERERNEANYFLKELAEADAQLKVRMHELCEVLQKAEQERDEARAELAEWTDSAKNVRKEYDDEQHCSCIPILRKLLKDAERKRDEWAAMCGRYKQERDEARLDKRGG
jgi:uncharacterized coiled-coil DUF342 family protein